jgi:energy-coupling factor transport system permease protein
MAPEHRTEVIGRRTTTASRRSLHPAAWWLWAGSMACAAIRTTNPLLLALIAAVAAFVVSARRTAAPWSRSLVFFFRLGVAVIVVRVGVQIIFGNRLPGHVLFTLPHLPLPSWAQGVSVGGPVTLESVLQAAVDGLRLAVVLICFGAANSLASPYRLLRCLPAVLYEAGVAVTVSLAFAPEVVMAIASVRDARRLRGRPTRGVAGLRGMAIPVLESALDRSLQLASSMDSRGYGRRAAVAQPTRRLGNASTVAGLLLVIVGIYGVLDVGSLPAGGVPFVVVGAVLVGTGMAAGGRRTQRTRYRPDVWRSPEWVVVGAGALVLATFVAASVSGVGGLQLEVYPPHFPMLPLLPAVGILAGLLPAVVVPMPRNQADRGEPTAIVTSHRPSVEPVEGILT